MLEEYFWVITQAAGQSCGGHLDSSVLKFGFQVALRNIELLPDLLECNNFVIERVSLLTSV